MAASSANAARFSALAALLCALCVADAAVTCPATGSGSTSISCYEGGTFAGTPPMALVTGGLCTYLCGPTSPGDYDYQTSNGSTTQFTATGTAACTAASCTTNFPTACAAANSPTPVFLTAAQALAAQALASKVAGTNTICMSVTATCKMGATNPCPSFLSSGTVTQSFAITPQGSATVTQVCAATLAMLAAKGVTVTAMCATNNCNAPSSSAAAVAAPKALLLAAAVVALAAVVM